MLLTEATRLVSGADTRPLGPVALPGHGRPRARNQLVGPTLGGAFPPLRSGVPSPLDGMEHADADFDGRIERAEAAFEQRMKDQIAGFVERALEAPFRKPKKRG